jgi:hypothetical protein
MKVMEDLAQAVERVVALTGVGMAGYVREVVAVVVDAVVGAVAQVEAQEEGSWETREVADKGEATLGLATLVADMLMVVAILLWGVAQLERGMVVAVWEEMKLVEVRTGVVVQVNGKEQAALETREADVQEESAISVGASVKVAATVLSWVDEEQSVHGVVVVVAVWEEMEVVQQRMGMGALVHVQEEEGLVTMP